MSYDDDLIHAFLNTCKKDYVLGCNINTHSHYKYFCYIISGAYSIVQEMDDTNKQETQTMKTTVNERPRGLT